MKKTVLFNITRCLVVMGIMLPATMSNATTHLTPAQAGETVDKVVMEDDFDDYDYELKEWHGSNRWTTDHGVYIRVFGDNKVLKFGDNEGDGSATTKALDLSANEGNFRLRLKMDGWNDSHNALCIEVLNKDGKVLDKHIVSVYQPGMGTSLRAFDLTLKGGTAETYVRFSTSMSKRIAIIDDVEIFQSSQPAPSYIADKEVIDFGMVAPNAEVADIVLNITGKHLKSAPKVKIVGDRKRFMADSELTTEGGKITVMLNNDTKGEFSSFLQIDHEGVNTILIPIKAVVRDLDNIYDLDDSNPVETINQDFEASHLLPDGWKSVALTGTQKWTMRTNGQVIGANRYPAIDALGKSLQGKVNSVLIMPALDLSKASQVQLSFNLTTLKPNGAKLFISQVKKTGEVTRIKEITQNAEAEWANMAVTLNDLQQSAPVFLAFEYEGMAGSQTTIYRIDNVNLSTSTSAVNSIARNEATIAVTGGQLTLNALKQGSHIAICNMQGSTVVVATATSPTWATTLPAGLYMVTVDNTTHKIIIK